MGRGPKQKVSGEKIKHYRTALGLSWERLAGAAHKCREANETIHKLKRGGPSKSTVRRLETHEEGSEETVYDVLAALQQRTAEAHNDGDNPLTPDTLPIPSDLITPVEEEIKRYRQAQAKRNSAATAVDSSSGPTGIWFSKKRLSFFEAFYELGETIRQSESAKILYASIGTGQTLRFLLSGLSDLKHKVIEKVVVRAVPVEDSDYLAMREYFMTTVASMMFLDTDFDIELYRWSRRVAAFNAFMYGDKVIYLRTFPQVLLSEYPWDLTTYKLTDQDDDIERFNKYYELLVYGHRLSDHDGRKKKPDKTYRVNRTK